MEEIELFLLAAGPVSNRPVVLWTPDKLAISTRESCLPGRALGLGFNIGLVTLTLKERAKLSDLIRPLALSASFRANILCLRSRCESFRWVYAQPIRGFRCLVVDK